MSHNVMQCHDTVMCCDAVLRLTGRGSLPVCLEYFLPKQQSWKCPLNLIISRAWSATLCRWGRATPCPLTWWRGWSTSTPWWCSPTGSWRPIRVGDITWGADTRPRRNSCRMTSTWGKPSGKTCMVANLDNCKNVDPKIVKWNAPKKLHYTEEVILPDPFFLLPIILNFLTSSWLNFSVEHENGSLIVLFLLFPHLSFIFLIICNSIHWCYRIQVQVGRIRPK